MERMDPDKVKVDPKAEGGGGGGGQYITEP